MQASLPAVAPRGPASKTPSRSRKKATQRSDMSKEFGASGAAQETWPLRLNHGEIKHYDLSREESYLPREVIQRKFNEARNALPRM